MVCENDTIELGEERLQSDEIESIGTLEAITLHHLSYSRFKTRLVIVFCSLDRRTYL